MNEKVNEGRKNTLQKAFGILFWLAIWEIAAAATGSELILPGIGTTVKAAGELLKTAAFYTAFGGTILRVVIGVILSVALGILVGILSAFVPMVRAVFEPFVSVIRSLPVVSVSILLNLWLASPAVPIAVTFFVAFPITWTNVLEGIRSTDPMLVEMAEVYGVGRGRRLRDLYLPSIAPFVSASLVSAVGMGWKSTVTAEVLAAVGSSVGMNLYYDKLYLQTPSLFAWTLMLILVSLISEWALKRVIKAGRARRAVAAES